MDIAKPDQPLVTATTAEPATARELLRDEHVRQGFQELGLRERLDPTTARAIYQADLRAAADHIRATVPLLLQAPGIRDGEFKVITSGSNQVRLGRAIDFALPGDRILEVGVGFGYMTCLLLRDTAPASYVGVDLTETRLEAVQRMLAANGLRRDHAHLEIKDLYEMTPQWVQQHDPDLIFLLEVLEHVPDAELALATLADSVRDDAAILFSVPVYGRIEHCWGHVSLFDASRIQAMCDGAGLVVQHVEVVQDTWVFVLASRSPAVPPRLLNLLRQRRLIDFDHVGVGRFVGIPPRSMTASGSASVQPDRGARVSVGPAGARWRTQVGGLAFDIPGDVRVRLELTFDEPYRIKKVHVALRAAGGETTDRWTWNTRLRPPSRRKRTFVFRRGLAAGPFKPVLSGGMVGVSAQTAEVTVEARGRVTFTVHRAAACTQPTNSAV